MTRHLDRPGTGGKSAPLIPLQAAAGQYRTEDGAPQNAYEVVAERRAPIREPSAAHRYRRRTSGSKGLISPWQVPVPL